MKKVSLPVRLRHLQDGSADMEMMLWNAALTAIVTVMGFFLKGKFEELDRLGILLNRTREEVARDHITRSEFRADMQQLLDRFDRIERKLDNLKGMGNALN
jgi:hypothetical protein